VASLYLAGITDFPKTSALIIAYLFSAQGVKTPIFVAECPKSPKTFAAD
jgi:hypothetical protein